MKKLISSLVIGGILGSFLFVSAETTSWLAQKATFKVIVRGEEFVPENPPIVVEGRTYLPLRSLGEALGVDVVWNAELKQAEVGMSQNPVTETGSTATTGQAAASTVTSWTAYKATFKVMVRGEEFVSENPPIVVEGRTYLPLRAMGNALGVKVDWNADLKQAIVGDAVEATPTATATPAPVVTPKATTKISDADTINFEMATVEAKAGEMVSIPITLSNITDIGIAACDFEVAYNSENLEFVEVTAGEIVKNASINLSSNLEEAGKINFLFLDNTMKDEAITTNGVFATIKFKVKDTAKAGKYTVEVSGAPTFGDTILASMDVVYKSGAVNVVQ
ncbi:MAG: Cellulosome-anchoring protein precursor [Firmicutes bacterium ADurb.Bin419]|nr:MAG: Cellulosome-anchoring protein precursor [Firmicutes bacterium ADurb.Bin419]